MHVAFIAAGLVSAVSLATEDWMWGTKMHCGLYRALQESKQIQEQTLFSLADWLLMHKDTVPGRLRMGFEGDAEN